MTEVAAILFYLAKRFPEATLLPEGGIEAEAQAISWMSFTAATLHPARQRGAEHANAMFAIADRKLAKREWALDRYSIADIHLFRVFWRFRGWFNPPRENFPYLSAHYDRMMAREAVRKTCEVEAALGYELPA